MTSLRTNNIDDTWRRSHVRGQQCARLFRHRAHTLVTGCVGGCECGQADRPPRAWGARRAEAGFVGREHFRGWHSRINGGEAALRQLRPVPWRRDNRLRLHPLPVDHMTRRMNILWAALLASISASALLVAPGCTARRTDSVVSRDEYDVISAVMDTFYTSDALDGSRPSLFVLEAYSAVPPKRGLGWRWMWPDRMPMLSDVTPDSSRDETLDRLQADLPDFRWRELRPRFDSLVDQSVQWDSNSIHISRPLVLAFPPKTRSDSLARRTLGYFWPRPGAGRLARISRVAFDQAHEQALVYYFEGGDGACWMFFGLKKVASRWVLKCGRGHFAI